MLTGFANKSWRGANCKGTWRKILCEMESNVWLVSKLVHVVAVEGITAERVIFAASDNNRVQMLKTHLHDGASQVVGVATTTADAAEKGVKTKNNGK